MRNHLTELQKILQQLPAHEQRRVLWYARLIALRRLLTHPAAFLGTTGGLFIFLILAAMPPHPMSLVIASGGGLCVAILLQRLRKYV